MNAILEELLHVLFLHHSWYCLSNCLTWNIKWQLYVSEDCDKYTVEISCEQNAVLGPLNNEYYKYSFQLVRQFISLAVDLRIYDLCDPVSIMVLNLMFHSFSSHDYSRCLRNNVRSFRQTSKIFILLHFWFYFTSDLLK